MIPIPGFIIALVTFPGVIVHEFAHYLFCRIFRVAVFEVCFLRVGNPAGYVIHEHPRFAWQSVMIGVGPFFVNTITGAIIGLPAACAVFEFGSHDPFQYILLYIGISIAMHSFPSVGDASSIWETLWGEDSKASLPLKLLVTPVVGLIYLGAAASILWLDAFYGYAVVRFGSSAVLHLFA